MQVEAQLRGRTSSAAAAAVRTDMEIKWWRIGMETRSSGGEWEERAESGGTHRPAAASKPSQCHPGTSDIYIQFLRLSR